MFQTPEPDDRIDPSPGFGPYEPSGHTWGPYDLFVFAFFFLVTVIFFPLAALSVMRIFRPDVRVQDLTVVEQVVLQGIMDVVLVAFIMFWVKVVRHRHFRETIHWYRRHPFRTASLVSLGATLAITVLLISAFFPTAGQTPIEKMISSARSLYVFALFGIFVAPTFEEIIFRGFLFKVFYDMSGPALAVPATAGLFAFLHAFQLWGNWPAIALIFVVGYALAFLRNRSGSLIPSLIVHTSYNAMLFGMYALSTLMQKGVKAGG
jgi:membrane protease YdiL (CAAX protease family)